MQHREIIIRALEQYRGDNYARAKAAFRNCTPAQMQEQYGQSGQTRMQILDGYAEHERDVNEALSWVNTRSDV